VSQCGCRARGVCIFFFFPPKKRHLGSRRGPGQQQQAGQQGRGDDAGRHGGVWDVCGGARGCRAGVGWWKSEKKRCEREKERGQAWTLSFLLNLLCRFPFFFFSCVLPLHPEEILHTHTHTHTQTQTRTHTHTRPHSQNSSLNKAQAGARVPVWHRTNAPQEKTHTSPLSSSFFKPPAPLSRSCQTAACPRPL
jgi:hypothetical protein